MNPRSYGGTQKLRKIFIYKLLLPFLILFLFSSLGPSKRRYDEGSFSKRKRCLSSHKNRGATSNFSLGQPQRIYCIFCSFQTTFFTKKLQTSARFELGLLELKASTLTTRPPPQTYLQNCFEKCALLKVPFRHSAIFNSLKKISKVLTILSKRMKDYFTNSVTRFGENFATLATFF